VPPALDRIVRRALDKKPELRFQSAHDLAFALETLTNASSSGTRAAAPHERGPVTGVGHAWILRLIPWAVAAGAVAFAAWTTVTARPVVDAGRLTRLEMSLPAGIELHVFGGSMAISPDGRTVGFIGVRGGIRQAYVRRLEQIRRLQSKARRRRFGCSSRQPGSGLALCCPMGRCGW
jgi:hypothetical protein